MGEEERKKGEKKNIEEMKRTTDRFDRRMDSAV